MRATDKVEVFVYPHERMEWLALSKLLRSIDFHTGKPAGSCRRWFAAHVRKDLKLARERLASMGLDPDRILAERFGQQSPPPDETDSGYGNVSDVSNDPD
jgi:hypothetical protein